MSASLAAGRALHIEVGSTIADGLAAPMAGTLNHRLVARYAAGIVTVPDYAIRDAMALLLERTKLLVEPAGAAGLAALLDGAIPLDGQRPVVIVLSGGNVDIGRLGELLGRA